MYSTALLFALGGIAAVSAAPMRRDTGTKAVFAHHMVGFTAPYTSADWLEDITLAHAAGIDGFALNIGTDSFQSTQIAAAYAAAESSGTGFKLFFSFDMSSFPCTTAADAAPMVSYIKTYANHPNQFKYNSRVFASTFSGETCTFGQSSVAQGWATQFIGQLTGANAVHFVPSFFIDPATFNQYSSSINGMFNWNSGWPIQMTTASVNSELASSGESLSATAPADIEKITSVLLPNVGAVGTDQQYVTGLQSVTSNDGKPPTYMGAVTPWFFTHYGVNSYNKNWIYYSDSHLYNTRWEQIIENRNLFDIVEIATWNDYSESHYIGPIHGAQPNSQDWVNGFDHTAFLNMTNYYVQAYKTGTYPSVNQDQVYIWARPHPKNANAPDPTPKPTNYEMTQDLMWAVVFNTQPSTVTLWTSDTTSQIFDLPAGVSKISTPLTETGGYMRAMMQRNGQTVTDFAPSTYYYQPNPSLYNYNIFTAGWAGAVTSTSAPPPPPPPPTSTSHQIHPNGDTAKCLDVQGGVFASGTPVQIYDCNGTAAQNWVLVSGQTTVQVAGQNYCLDAGDSPASGTQMKIWECISGIAAQTWYYTTDDRISLENQGQCLDLTNGLLTDGTVMQIWSCTDNDTNQVWTLS